MDKNKLEALQGELCMLFIKYGVVPQGYDFDLWTREQNEESNKKHNNIHGTFETVVNNSVINMLCL